MSKDDRYFQFPLSCLAFGADSPGRLVSIVNWCCLDMGERLTTAMSKKQMQQHVSEMPQQDLPSGLCWTNATHLKIVAGMKKLGLKHGLAANMAAGAAALAQFIHDMAATHGRFPVARVRTDMFFDAVKGKMPYREFSVLCGVYAVIGAKEFPVRITRDRIKAGALGYKTFSMVTADAIGKRQDGAKPLTTDRLRHTLDTLESMGCFVRVQAGRRTVYFSNRMTREAVTEHLLASKTRREAKLSKNRAADRELQARIRGATGGTIKVGPVPQQPPRIPHTPPTATPQRPHESPTLIKGDLAEGVFTETLLKKRAVAGAPAPAALEINFPKQQSGNNPDALMGTHDVDAMVNDIILAMPAYHAYGPEKFARMLRNRRATDLEKIKGAVAEFCRDTPGRLQPLDRPEYMLKGYIDAALRVGGNMSYKERADAAKARLAAKARA